MRLLTRRQFSRVKNSAHKMVGKLLQVDIASSKFETTRLGICTPKSYGNSCKRNRFKRCVREAFRTRKTSIPHHIDIVIKPRRQALEASSCQIGDEMVSLICAWKPQQSTTESR